MRGQLLMLTLILCSWTTWAQKISGTYRYKNFEEAKGAPSRLQFIIKSTKMAVYSSDVDGYVKAFSYSAELDEKNMILRNMIIKFNAIDMDTDNGSRNTKLYNHCMSYQQYPIVEMTVPGPLFLKSAASRSYPGQVNIRGKQKPFTVELSSQLKEKTMLIEGKSVWGFKEMEIPDPSIFIANVSNDIRIYIRLEHHF